MGTISCAPATTWNGNDEAFTFKYAEVLNVLSDDTLTVKSATRTFRFRTTASASENKAQLRDLAEAIARARR